MRLSSALRAGCVGLAVAAALLSGCDRRTPAPPAAAAEVSADAIGYYCGMRLVEHDGPKGQVQLAGRSEPVWFSSVRDTLVFLRSPEEPRDIVAVYVNDMGRSAAWAQPDRGAWVDPRQAWFVLDSGTRGGMGAPEAVPFGEQAAADAYRAAHGGRVVRLADIPDAWLFGAGSDQLPAAGAADDHPAPDHAAPDHATHAPAVHTD